MEGDQDHHNIDPCILFVKLPAIKQADKKMLSGAGIYVIEVADPTAVNFVRASAQVQTTDMLAAYAKSVKSVKAGAHRNLKAKS